jgi:ribonuclease Z
MEETMFVTVLGSSGCRYDKGNDTASFLINNKIIVDTGWNLVENILNLGLNPADFKTVLFTHFHHDHYMALPQFLFYHICGGKSLDEITLIGPGDLNLAAKLALDFLQLSRFYENPGEPECIMIESDGEIVLDDYKLLIKAQKSIHPVDGRFYHVTDMQTGKIAGFAGDTAYDPAEIEFFKGCGLLIHECSLGGKYSGDNNYLHASAEEAAIVAEAAGVKKLALVHYGEKLREDCRNAAAEKFSGGILTPVKGDVIYV